MLLLLLGLQVALVRSQLVFIQLEVHLVVLILPHERIAHGIPFGVVAAIVLVRLSEGEDVDEEEGLRGLPRYGIVVACSLRVERLREVADETLIDINVLQVVVDLSVQRSHLCE